ncbi:MAG: Jag N-terminal domain-containing protein, partial [Campylobacterota bacterium]|nr:Jag N-terminal domain-containing protein [Campylobacterota bacterium]
MSKRFEANSLEEVYEKASSSLKHSLNELDIEIIQNPSKGFLGFFSKKAIIKAKVNKKKHSYKKENTNIEQNINIEKLSTRLDELNLQEDTSKNNNNIENEIKISQISKNQIFDEFYDRNNSDKNNEDVSYEIKSKNNHNIENEIKKQVDQLFSNLCYELDDIVVKQIDEKTIYIKFNGKDSALLIGKEGYRYKALSYILFNWIN